MRYFIKSNPNHICKWNIYFTDLDPKKGRLCWLTNSYPEARNALRIIRQKWEEWVPHEQYKTYVAESATHALKNRYILEIDL